MHALIVTFLALGPPPSTPPPPDEINADGVDSEIGAVCLPAKYSTWSGQTLTATGATCKASVRAAERCPDKFELAWSGCEPAGCSVTVTGPQAERVTVKRTPVKPCAAPAQWKDAKLVLGATPFTGTVHYGDLEGRWSVREIKGGAVADGDRTAIANSAKRVFASVSVDVCVSSGPLDPPANGATDGASNLAEQPDLGAAADLDAVLDDLGTWCRLESKAPRFPKLDTWRRHRETVCLWTDGRGKFVEVYRAPHLLPGKQLNVVLIGPKELALRARQEGTIGYAAELDEQVSTGAALVTPSPPTDVKSGQSQRWVFEGRGAGLAPVIFEREPGKEVYRVEIDYPRTYLGSVRVGFGLVWGNAVGPRYEAVQQPGSPTYEIVQKEGSKVASELVLSYSVYPEAMLGGRNYRERLFSRNNWGFGPVVGIGTVSAANGKVDLFRSLYLGLEFEPVRFFSIAVGPVLRRVDGLADGFHVGSALADARVPTKERLSLGWFFMINVSPRFMKTAAPGK